MAESNAVLHIEADVSSSKRAGDASPHSYRDGVLDQRILDGDWWTDLSWSLLGWRTAAKVFQHEWIVDMALPTEVDAPASTTSPQ